MLIKTILTTFLVLFVVAPNALQGAGSHCVVNAQTPAKQQVKKPIRVNRYSCPMHPETRSTRRGKCPKCGMTLRLVKEEPNPETVPTTTAATGPADSPEEPNSSISSIRIPDVDVYDQNGKRLKFHSDLIKGKTVAINFIFTTCTAICPSLTATFRRVQQEIDAQKLPVELISISVDPVIDTPERLREFATKFKAGPGWTFVTGEKAAIDSILRVLGTAVAVKTDHTPMILIGNEASNYWTRTYGLSSPSTLTKLIADAANRK